MAFRINQEVQCVDGGGRLWRFVEDREQRVPGPAHGEVFRVEAIETFDGEQYLSFAEFPDRYIADAFRPLIRTDISIFLAMLNAKPKRVQKPTKVTT